MFKKCFDAISWNIVCCAAEKVKFADALYFFSRGEFYYMGKNNRNAHCSFPTDSCCYSYSRFSLFMCIAIFVCFSIFGLLDLIALLLGCFTVCGLRFKGSSPLKILASAAALDQLAPLRGYCHKKAVLLCAERLLIQLHFIGCENRFFCCFFNSCWCCGLSACA